MKGLFQGWLADWFVSWFQYLTSMMVGLFVAGMVSLLKGQQLDWLIGQISMCWWIGWLECLLVERTDNRSKRREVLEAQRTITSSLYSQGYQIRKEDGHELVIETAFLKIHCIGILVPIGFFLVVYSQFHLCISLQGHEALFPHLLYLPFQPRVAQLSQIVLHKVRTRSSFYLAKSIIHITLYLVFTRISEFEDDSRTDLQINSCVAGIAVLLETHKSDKYTKNLQT